MKKKNTIKRFNDFVLKSEKNILQQKVSIEHHFISECKEGGKRQSHKHTEIATHKLNQLRGKLSETPLLIAVLIISFVQFTLFPNPVTPSRAWLTDKLNDLPPRRRAAKTGEKDWRLSVSVLHSTGACHQCSAVNDVCYKGRVISKYINKIAMVLTFNKPKNFFFGVNIIFTNSALWEGG